MVRVVYLDAMTVVEAPMHVLVKPTFIRMFLAVNETGSCILPVAQTEIGDADLHVKIPDDAAR